MKSMAISRGCKMTHSFVFSNVQVLVVGDLMLDKYLHSEVVRISPEAPVPVAHVKREEARVGGAANVAANCATLGARARVLGLVGEDDDARALQEILARYSVVVGMPPHPDCVTISKLRVMSRGQQLMRLDFEDRTSHDTSKMLEPYFDKALPEASVVVFSDYGKGALSGVRDLLVRAKAAGKMTIVDPKGKDFERYRGASIITPNLSEFTTVVGPCRDDAELTEKARNMARELDLGGVLVTRSERGMIYVPCKGEVISVASRVRDVFDVTGAGDTVVAGLAVALAAGRSLEEAVILSNICAGVVVGKVGTSTVSLEELDNALAGQYDRSVSNTAKGGDARNKIVSVAELKIIREQLRRDGRSLVMTNGCFDVLHAGHVSYIRAAAREGDVLAIAVNSDESVRGLKGATRPINPLEARTNILSALQDVDWVVSFSDPDPKRLYKEILPDVLVKGADYSDKEIVGAEDVINAGGRIKLIEFVDGFSSTSIIAKIKEAEK